MRLEAELDLPVDGEARDAGQHLVGPALADAEGVEALQPRHARDAAHLEEPRDHLLVDHAAHLAGHARGEEEAGLADGDGEAAGRADRVVDELAILRQHRLLLVVGGHDASAAVIRFGHALQPVFAEDELYPGCFSRDLLREVVHGWAEPAVHDNRVGPLASLRPKASAIEVVLQRRYNPEGKSRLNIVPGLLAVILTMTLVMMTALGVTRERERGTMENLLAMPVRPVEVMIGKILPYIALGSVQVFVFLIVSRLLFDVAIEGSVPLLALGTALFITVNLAIGFTVSTMAQNQLQAMQASTFVLLPSILLSGFMFPFRGMPVWAQWLGEGMPATHFMRIVRGVMLKAANMSDISSEILAILAIIAINQAACCAAHGCNVLHAHHCSSTRTVSSTHSARAGAALHTLHTLRKHKQASAWINRNSRGTGKVLHPQGIRVKLPHPATAHITQRDANIVSIIRNGNGAAWQHTQSKWVFHV